ncbi:phosphopantetheine-binding protein [Streptomyces niveus]|uniref:phosphopantetheine-binding protein n=1 Tax=Streptomyces niveus TaxID=193462 RepID=UPI0036D3CBEB
MEEHTGVKAGDHVRKQIVAWAAELLEEPQASETDNFFDLGGHSVLALTLIGQVKERYGVEVDIRALFEQNLGEMAADVARQTTK